MKKYQLFIFHLMIMVLFPFMAPAQTTTSKDPHVEAQLMDLLNKPDASRNTQNKPVSPLVPAAQPQVANPQPVANQPIGNANAKNTLSPQIAPPATLPGDKGTSPQMARVDQGNKVKDPYAWEGSIMFLPKELQEIEQAIMNYELSELDKKIKEQQFQSLFANPDQQKKIQIPPAPVFYLSSIVFDAPGIWSVWVNNDRMTSKEKESQGKNGLKLVSVNKDEATFTWETDALDVMVPAWREKLKNPEKKPQLAMTNPVAVKDVLDQNKTRLEFTLKPNQTFVVARMSIIEGKLKEVIPPPTPDQVAASMPKASPEQLPDDVSWTDLPTSTTAYVPPAGLPSQGGSDVDPTEKYRGMKHIQEKTPTPQEVEDSIKSSGDAKKLLEDITTQPSQ